MIAALGPFLSALLASGATGWRIDKLPDWAAPVVREGASETPPAGADAWVLLQSTELVYVGGGGVQARQRRVVQVLGERGLGEQHLLVAGLAGKGSKLKGLKGWNARPDGEVERISRDDVVSLEGGQSRVQGVTFAGAMKGSVLVFESTLESDHPMGPVEVLPVMESEPVRRWSLAARTERPGVEVRLDPQHLAPWLPAVDGPVHAAISFRDVPARPPREAASPADRNSLPWIQVSFHDSSMQKDVPSNASWDSLAAWTQAHYATRLATARLSPGPVHGLGGATARDALQAIHDWMAASLVYRQVYLTPERGWVPSAADEVARRRYGDCKDLATLFVSEARLAGLPAYPVLARIAEGWVEDVEPASIFAFNHVIAAVRLPASLGLPAEVQVPQGLFLLVDPTARFTPFGHLPDAHAGRRVLVCLETGGIWITVPGGATDSPQARYTLEGRLVKPWGFEGTLEVREEHALEGFRAAAADGGLVALRKACLHLGLPADAHCEVKRQSDPLRLDSPYTVLFALAYQDAVRTAGTGEWTLNLPGLPTPPLQLAGPGHPRELPVSFDERSSVEYEAHLQAPWRLSAVAPAERGETAFRTYEWTTSVRPAPGGSEIEFRLSHRLRPATFDFDRREEGVGAWKKDRAAVQRLLDNAVALKAE
ncbi:MAG TPA: transglutaminase-like domain-containing protein [Vicinamibacteria bacterium]|nr:transglutaminase-like domain-containing protein [Vicinamibacteria bacterium]